jgi:hypothetical protein
MEIAMRKHIITALSMLTLLPSAVQSDVSGLWISEQKPGWYMSMLEAPGLERRFIGMQVLNPPGTDWDIFVGPEGSADAALLGPAITDSDMKSQWTSRDNNNGTLEVQSCTQNCPFNAGETIQWVKIWGETVDPSGPPPEGVVATGLWTGPDTCFFVNSAGTQIVDSDQCDDGKALSASGTGVEFDIDARLDPDVCQASVTCDGAWSITYEAESDPVATCNDGARRTATIYFDSSTSAQVEAWNVLDLSLYCVAIINTMPMQ